MILQHLPDWVLSIPIYGWHILAAVFLGMWILAFVISHSRLDQSSLLGKVALAISTALVVKILMIVGVVGVGAFWLVPVPKLVTSTPKMNAVEVPLDQELVFEFDRPMERQQLAMEITPEIPGWWEYQSPLINTSLFTRLVFHPTFSLQSGTQYTVKLSNISSIFGSGEEKEEVVKFRTLESLGVVETRLKGGSDKVSPLYPVEITLNRHLTRFEKINVTGSGESEFEVISDQTGQVLLLKPTSPLKQGAVYQLILTVQQLQMELNTGQIVNASSKLLTQLEMTTRKPAGIEMAGPIGRGISPKSNIEIVFSEAMNKLSVEKLLRIEPPTPGELVWESDRKLKFVPVKLELEQNYQVVVEKMAETVDGGYLPEDVVVEFITIGPVAVASSSPANGATGVEVSEGIKITFDQLVDEKSLLDKVKIIPQTKGIFTLDGKTLSFKPESDLAFNQQYKVSFQPGIVSAGGGLDSRDVQEVSFLTRQQVHILPVAIYRQKYSLSCEFAASKMALEYKGVSIDEDTLIGLVGFDSTAKYGGVWGDPYEKFVGKINGRQMVSGYGVYWGPIAAAIGKYRATEVIEQSTVEKLTNSVLDSNPVVVWTYSANGSPTTWNTPTGKLVKAVAGEHAVVVVGFVGDKIHPSQIIINDPLGGRVYMPVDEFIKRWESLGRSGVVVY